MGTSVTEEVTLELASLLEKRRRCGCWVCERTVQAAELAPAKGQRCGAFITRGLFKVT